MSENKEQTESNSQVFENLSDSWIVKPEMFAVKNPEEDKIRYLDVPNEITHIPLGKLPLHDTGKVTLVKTLGIDRLKSVDELLETVNKEIQKKETCHLEEIKVE